MIGQPHDVNLVFERSLAESRIDEIACQIRFTDKHTGITAVCAMRDMGLIGLKDYSLFAEFDPRLVDPIRRRQRGKALSTRKAVGVFSRSRNGMERIALVGRRV